MTQEETWDRQWAEIVDYINQHGRCPSKHRLEEHKMLNWIKYNKKRLAAGTLPRNRIQRFYELLAIVQQNRKINQYV